MDFNINDFVFVKLTAKGREQLAKCYAPISRYPSPDEKTGEHRFQLWELMNIFGARCFNGGDQMFVNNLIRFGETK